MCQAKCAQRLIASKVSIASKMRLLKMHYLVKNFVGGQISCRGQYRPFMLVIDGIVV